MTRWRAILLDLDGTLVDASAPLAAGILELAGEIGLAVPTLDWARGRIGYSPDETWRLLGASDPPAVAARFRQRYLPGLAARTRLLPGAGEALSELAGRGYRLALASTRSTESATETLAAAGWLAHFGFIAGGDLVTRHKPHPDVLQLALERLGCASEQALMVGDTAADVQAAHAAGMPCWSVLGGIHDEPTLRAAGTDLVLRGGIADLPSALRSAEEARRPRPVPQSRPPPS